MINMEMQHTLTKGIIHHKVDYTIDKILQIKLIIFNKLDIIEIMLEKLRILGIELYHHKSSLIK